ncbi:ATP-grasp domain-containing protein [Halomicrobium salinisoli]|uniref:ATP-grasp domain-containing protein n=1 Tax=Halomicrobium salinisoli TaxID=2878391 RepID=UPI001CF0A3C5|nr:ATP-grasp domain-containing protein [Halomicrobium salinisoli]
MTVALLGAPDDPQIAAVRAALNDRSVESVVWDADRWPGDAPLTFEAADGASATVGDDVSLTDLNAVYLRRMALDPRGPEFEGELEERPYSLMNQLREYRGLLGSILRHLSDAGVRVVNPPEASRLHSLKPYQIAVFEDAGVPVPETLATNDPSAVRAFLDRVGDVVYKPVAGGGHARRLTPEDCTDERLSRLSNAPVQFQERLDGTNYRLYVVGGEVAATGRIESDELDYRLGEHEVVSGSLSDAVERAAVRAASLLDLPFAGVDVVLTDDGFGVLEANPSPMFAAFDERAGTDVAGYLAAHLAE